MSDPGCTAYRILVVDDEPQIQRFLAISLRAQGYVVETAATGAEGLAAAEAGRPDLVVLDLGLPDRDGLSVLRELRAGSAMPILVLTVRSGESEKVAALDGGANDYVTKPFGLQEFMARVRALLRSRAGSGSEPVVFDDGHLHVDLGRREVRLDGAPVVLGRKEFALLSVLLRHGGRVVTQPQLLREVWGPSHVEDTHYLRILVARLRQKLGDEATSPRYLATEPGVGLRFLVPEPGAS